MQSHLSNSNTITLTNKLNTKFNKIIFYKIKNLNFFNPLSKIYKIFHAITKVKAILYVLSYY